MRIRFYILYGGVKIGLHDAWYVRDDYEYIIRNYIRERQQVSGIGLLSYCFSPKNHALKRTQNTCEAETSVDSASI